MTRYRYISCHPITRQQLDPSLRLIDPQWSWAVGGNGTLTAKISVPESEEGINRLKLATQPHASAIYVKDSQGQYPWGGYVVNRTWDPTSGQVTIQVAEWRTWVYAVALPPEVDMTGDILYSWTSTDQITIARQILMYLVAGGASTGSPSVMYGVEPLSGRARDLNVYGTALRSGGELIDSIANRDYGFEWSMEVRPHPIDGLPQLYFSTYYPQRGGLVSGLLFKHTQGGGNLLGYGAIEESAADRAFRFWATGVGQAPDQVFAVAVDPLLAQGNHLRREKSSNFSSVSDRSTLASHARRSLKFYSPGTNLIRIVTPLSSPDVDSYSVGDRARLMISDRWTGIDEPSVRIVEKTVDMSGTGRVSLTLDLSDLTLPEVDTGGAV